MYILNKQIYNSNKYSCFNNLHVKTILYATKAK